MSNQQLSPDNAHSPQTVCAPYQTLSNTGIQHPLPSSFAPEHSLEPALRLGFSSTHAPDDDPRHRRFTLPHQKHAATPFLYLLTTIAGLGPISRARFLCHKAGNSTRDEDAHAWTPPILLPSFGLLSFKQSSPSFASQYHSQIRLHTSTIPENSTAALTHSALASSSEFLSPLSIKWV